MPATAPVKAPAPQFHERRTVPWWWWVVAIGFVVPTAEAVVVLGPQTSVRAGWGAAIACLVVCVVLVAVALLGLSRSQVVLDADGLHADRQHLRAGSIGRVRVLDRDTARAVLGRQARADAVLSLRPWVRGVVQIEVVDPGDPTPYWVVGCRHPTELAAALEELRAVTAAQGVSGSRAGSVE